MRFSLRCNGAKLATNEQKGAHQVQQVAWEKATAEVRGKMAAMVEPHIEKSVTRALKRFNDELQAMVQKLDAERAPMERQLVNLCDRQLSRARRTFDALKSIKSEEDKAKYKQLEVELKTFDTLKPKP